jgi:hypothetical protein
MNCMGFMIGMVEAGLKNNFTLYTNYGIMYL